MDKKNMVGKIPGAMYQNIRKKGWVSPVDVLLDIGILSKADYEYADKNGLKSSWTFYHQWGNKVTLRDSIGIAPSTLSRLSRNQTVSMNVLGRICKELDCNVGDIVDYIPD